MSLPYIRLLNCQCWQSILERFFLLNSLAVQTYTVCEASCETRERDVPDQPTSLHSPCSQEGHVMFPSVFFWGVLGFLFLFDCLLVGLVWLGLAFFFFFFWCSFLVHLTWTVMYICDQCPKVMRQKWKEHRKNYSLGW